jgi:hypothetical protein
MRRLNRRRFKMTTRRIPTLAALLALSLVLPAWVSATNPTQRTRRAAKATLHVTNNTPQPVYVVLIDERPDGWAQWPLGTIAADAARTFRVNPDVLGMPHIRIVSSAFSNWKEYESSPMTFRPGRQIDLPLNNPEPHSLLAAR